MPKAQVVYLLLMARGKMEQLKILKSLFVTLAILSACLVIMAPAKTSAGANDFVISDFIADYYLTKDAAGAAQLKTVETITAEFPDFDQNHGVLRAIPKKYLDNNLHVNVLSVKNEAGQNLNYTTYSENDNLVLKIGDEGVYVHGVQAYVITYTSNNVIRFFDNHDEWYWNVNGTQWQQQVTSLTARIHLTDVIAGTLQDNRACYAGSQDSKSSNCGWSNSNSTDAGGTVLMLTATKPLLAGETATFVLSFNENTFAPVPQTFWEQYGAEIFLITGVTGIIIVPVITFIVLLKKWRKFGRDPKGRGTIIPEYQAPKNLSVLGSSAVYNQSVASNAFSAQIVDLAIRGYMRIEENTKSKLIGKSQKHSLTLLKSADNQLTKEEKSLLEGIFEGKKVGTSVALDDLKNKFYAKTSKISKTLLDDLVTQNYFTKNPQKARMKCIIAGAIMVVVGFPLAVFLVGIGFILGGILCFIFAIIMPARTKQGLTAKEHLEGLKMYIKTAEKARFEYLQSVKRAERIAIAKDDSKNKIKLFEKLLPYAMLFGMEKSWAKQFEGIYVQPPDWYGGNWSTFNMVVLASSLGSFNTSANTSFATPSSSSGSGFGGGAGGGGGGGGGGGW